MRTARTAALFCAVAVAAACSNGDDVATTQGGATPKEMTLTATYPTTRVGFDAEGNGYWHIIDEIGVWSATAKKFVMFENSSDGGTATATFKGSIAEGDATAGTLVLYPYNTSHTQTTYYLPSTYDYGQGVDTAYTAKDCTNNSFRMPMKGAINVGSDGTKTVKFSNIGGVLAVRINRLPASAGTVTVTADKSICGNATIGASELAAPDGDKSVVFNYDLAKAFNPGVFYLPVAPGTYTVTVTAQSSDGNVAYTSSATEVTIQRAHIKKLPITADYSKEINGHKFVDLGLSSGTLWAETNIGATEATGYGDFYAWGETKVKDVYGWKDYAYGYSDDNENITISKYGSVDGKTTLEADDDVATVVWGAPCRMPTSLDFEEIYNSANCSWTRTKKTNSEGTSIDGYEVKSVKNGNSIFMPSTGWRNEGTTYYQGSYGRYWSSTINPAYTDGRDVMDFVWLPAENNIIYPHHSDRRCLGITVRPVAKL